MLLNCGVESPLDSKEVQRVHPKGDQSWVFFGRDDPEAETPVLGHLMQRVDSLEKTLMLGGIGGRRRRGRQRMRWLDGQRTPRADLLQNGLVGSPCSPMDSQESSPTPQFKSAQLSL